jgi:ribosome-binding ATPase YchF (GTP1/OBG family)
MADYDAKKEIYGKIKTALESGKPARSIALSEEEQTMVSDLNLLTMKPCIYAANVSENDLANKVSSCS